MGKEAIAFRTEDCLKKMSENNMKLLFTTNGFKLLGIITSDKKLPDEATGSRRRWVKGLVMENGHPLPVEDRVFETLLDRKNPRSGRLDEVIAHEDDLVIVTERKTFDLDDDEKNFRFMPNMHYMDKIHQMMDEIEEGKRRIGCIEDEKEESLLNADHFKREAQAAKEREKTHKELVNRLTRENSMLYEKVGNLESVSSLLRAKNLQLEAFVDELTANAQETGTIKAMTTDDLMIHAAEKKKELYNNMMDIEPGIATDEGNSGESETELKEQVKALAESVKKLIDEKQVQKVAT